MSLRHAILLLALSGCGSDKQPAYTIETLPGGVVHVVNHGPSGWADTLGWKIVLEAERTIPADSVGALSRPNYPHQLANGEIVVLDQGEMFVQRYDADFNPIGQFGRRGSGPGEFVNPGVRGMGDSIAVVEGSRSALVLLTGDGSFLYEAQLPTFTDWIGHRDKKGRLPLLGRYAPNSEAGVMWWSIAERRVVDSIIGPAGPEMRMWESCAFVIPYQPSLELVPTLDGNAWWGVSDADRFILTRTGSDTLRIVETPDRPRYPVPSQRIDEDLDPERGIGKFCRDMKRSDFPTTFPAWNGLEIDGDGNLWVRRPSGYDVYDPEGRWLGEVPRSLIPDGNPYWNGDVILDAVPEDDGAMTLRLYRIRRD